MSIYVPILAVSKHFCPKYFHIFTSWLLLTLCFWKSPHTGQNFESSFALGSNQGILLDHLLTIYVLAWLFSNPLGKENAREVARLPVKQLENFYILNLHSPLQLHHLPLGFSSPSMRKGEGFVSQFHTRKGF